MLRAGEASASDSDGVTPLSIEIIQILYLNLHVEIWVFTTEMPAPRRRASWIIFALCASLARPSLNELTCECNNTGLERSIESCGAIPNVNSVSTARENGRALACALLSAASESTVVVPYGARWFVIPYQSLDTLAPRVTLRIEGELVAHDSIKAWPRQGRAYLSLIAVHNASHFVIEGDGMINGQGHNWWWHFVKPGSSLRTHKRPILVEVGNCTDVVVRQISLLDSPRFNVYLGAVRRARVSGISIIVDWRKQRRLLIDAAKRRSGIAWAIQYAWISWFKPSWWSFPLPMFPFNTDGIDVSGEDILIENVVVSNWDDVVAVKPGKRASQRNDDDDDFSGLLKDEAIPPFSNWDWCTRNVTIRNVTTLFGAGISVGSVHPSEKLPCVKEVKFENIVMFRPVKGPYVKPDLAPDYCEWKQNCAALIANATFENVTMLGDSTPHWWGRFERRHRSRGGAYVEPRMPLENWARLRRKQGKLFAGSVSKLVAWLTRPPKASAVCRSKWFVNVLCFSWPIYVGTQQQQEPGGTGSGLWPKPEPLVTVTNITFRRVRSRGGSWSQSAAAIRCDAKNPCTNIHLEDVTIKGKFESGWRWICDDKRAAFGTEVGRVEPYAGRCVRSKVPYLPEEFVDSGRENSTTPPSFDEAFETPVYLTCIFVAIIIALASRRSTNDENVDDESTSLYAAVVSREQVVPARVDEL